MGLKQKNKKEKQKKSPHPKISPAKLWAFRIIACLVIPLLFLGLLEVALRLSGYGYPTETAIQQKLGEREVYRHNYQFGWRFFSKNIARDFNGFVFDTEKPPQTYRIFVVGASAAMGMPAPEYNVGRILEVMLNDMYPDIRFEVHTAAMVAINSHAALEIVKDCSQYDPDLFIVYLGNNEVVGPFGPGTIFSPLSPSLPLIRANIALKSTRTGQLLEQTVRSSTPAGSAPQRWGGLEMFLEKQVPHDSPALQTVYSHFKQNLRDICQTARHAGAAVIVSNVACNLKDSPPFGSMHRSDLTLDEKQLWEQNYNTGITNETAKQYSQAIESYLKAADIDSTYADLQFRLGRCFREISNFDQAKMHFNNALQYDTLRFRADGQINEIIQTIAENTEDKNLRFVDSVAFIEENSPHQIPGGDLFYEHVHFNFKGNYVLAQAIFPTIQRILPPDFKQQAQSVLTAEQAAASLAYTDFERHLFLTQIYSKMLNKPPFTNQLYHDEYMEHTKQQIDTIASNLQGSGMDHCRKQYQDALKSNPDDWQLAFRYAIFLGNNSQNINEKRRLLEKVIRLCPYDSAYLSLGKIYHKQGKINEAKKALHDLLELKPNAGRAHIELASIYGRLKDHQKYIEHLSKGLSFDPSGSIDAYGALAEAYDKSGEPDNAIAVLYKATRFFPEAETAQVHASLSYLLNTQGKYDQALVELNLALKINPDFANDSLFQSLQAHLKTKVKH